MNINASSATTINSPQIINYPRMLIDRKPDDDNSTRYVINSNQSATTSATVPQTVSIPLLSISGAGVTSANGVIAAKKCAFHRQCLHIHQSSPVASAPSQPQQAGHHHHHHQSNTIHLHPHQIQLPLQTASTTTAPPQQQIHQIQHQQIRINNLHASPSSVSIASSAVNAANPVAAGASSAAAAITVVNRASNGASQPKRDAISTNIAPQLNAALLQDRYLLLDMVDGSSFYKCIDIQTQKMLVCKVGGITSTFYFSSFNEFVLVLSMCTISYSTTFWWSIIMSLATDNKSVCPSLSSERELRLESSSVKHDKECSKLQRIAIHNSVEQCFFGACPHLSESPLIAHTHTQFHFSFRHCCHLSNIIWANIYLADRLGRCRVCRDHSRAHTSRTRFSQPTFFCLSPIQSSSGNNKYNIGYCAMLL